MIEYIYFVKCPNCEDEPFDFFDEAKEFALGCLSKKPIITQIEVDRNDFGECVGSSDLGTVWSWEELMSDVPNDSDTLFSKKDTFEADMDHDPEFTSFDNTLDTVPDNFAKPVPADMTIDALVEAMEENEDTVECKWCHELFDKSEVRYEVDLGYLCDQCAAAIKSRGETLTFKENNYQDFLDEKISLKPDLTEIKEDISRETVDLEYDELTTTVCSSKRDVDDWDEVEYSDSYTFTLDKTDVATTIWENFITEEDVVDIPGGLEALEDDSAWNAFLETHFDILFEKYYKELLNYYKEDAIKAFSESASYDDYITNQEANRADMEYDAWRDERDFTEDLKTAETDLDILEEVDTYKERLTLCPECGTDSFDLNTGLCINCGFNNL